MSRVEIEAVMPEGDFFWGEGAVVIGGDNLTSPGWNLTREKAFSVITSRVNISCRARVFLAN